MTKAVIIGLDGATWRLLDPLLQQGRLPNLQYLIEHGVRRTLISTRPPVTVPAWTTFATGVHPGKHGCYDFFLPGKSIRDFRPATSQEIKVPTLYELLHDQGKKVILMNLPNSYPPRVPAMTMVSDFMTIGDQAVFPASLLEKYPVLKRYRLSPDERLKLTTDNDAYIQHIIDLEKDRLAGMKELFIHEPWDIFFFLFSSTDWVSHLVFYDMLTQHHPTALQVFDVVDEFFGWLRQQLPAEANLYIMSDHGFTYYTELFYINRWLEQQGYLVTRSGAGQLEQDATARRRNLAAARSQRRRWRISKRWLNILFFHPVIERTMKWCYHHIVKPFFPVHITVDVGIDLDKTKVCFPRGSMLQTLYLNYQGNFKEGLITDRTEYDRVRQEVKEKLEALYTPSGKRVTEHVYTKEELYGNQPPTPSPDLHCVTKDVWIVGHLHSKAIFEQAISNKHDEFGIFIAYGPDIVAGEQLAEANIADIAPTILHQFNSLIPSYTDGRVLLDIFQNQAEPAQRPVRLSQIERSEKTQLNELVDNLVI
ncbi:MAG: alkaline phosphatase family protein [Candidatus Kerfeldbacteria bacterium]|nr:alkaline phosphatase family protein [Candidatus Kerfeldbacteria bacterium]